MKNILIILIASFFVSGIVSAANQFHFKRIVHTENPIPRLAIQTATTTILGPPKIITHFTDGAFEGQGVCIAIKDIDGNGYTYMTTNNGTATFSAASCR